MKIDSLTVRELIDCLQQFPDHLKVVIEWDAGYTKIQSQYIEIVTEASPRKRNATEDFVIIDATEYGDGYVQEGA